jgi:hypothetical protein
MLMRTIPRASMLVLLLAALLLASAVALAQVDPNTNCDLDPNRINNRPHRDCSAPVHIYLANDNILVLTPRIGISEARRVMQVPVAQPIPANRNTIIAEAINPFTNRPVILSRLTTGEYQLNTFYPDGTGYIVVWYGGPDLYHIDPVTNTPLDGARPIIAPEAINPSAGALSGVTTTGTTTTAPAATTPAAPGEPSLANCRVTTTRMVRLRAEPNPSSAVITTLPYRTTWRVTEVAPGWYRVIYLNTQGWVSADYLTPIGTCAV